jgi:hypothetical protein
MASIKHEVVKLQQSVNVQIPKEIKQINKAIKKTNKIVDKMSVKVLNGSLGRWSAFQVATLIITIATGFAGIITTLIVLL